MSAAVHGRNLGQALCEALDIDWRGVRSITIRAHVQEAGEVIVERLLHPDEVDDLTSTLTRYELSES